MLTLRHLRVFAEVARCGKMSQAAANLFISQPTVSQIIADLEREYNTKLFERYSKSVHLTEDGRRMLLQAQKIIAEADELDSMMREESATRIVNLGATITVCNMLAELVTEFERTHPGVRMNVYCGNSRSIEEQLLNNALDIALIEGRVDSPEILVEPIVDDYLVLVANSMHPLARQETVSLQDAVQYPFVMETRGNNTRDIFENYVITQGLSLDIKMECMDVGAVIELLRGNLGLSVLPLRLVQREVGSGELTIIPVGGSIWRRKFHLAHHKNKYLTRDLRDLSDLVRHKKAVVSPESFPSDARINLLY